MGGCSVGACAWTGDPLGLDTRVNSSIDPDGTDEEGPEWDCDRGFPDDAEEEDDGEE